LALYRPELYQDKAENILSRIPTDSVDCIIADPPYGISYESGWTQDDGAGTKGTFMNDTTTEFLEEMAGEFERILAPDSHCYVFTRWDAYLEKVDYFEDYLDLNTVIVWDKKELAMGNLETWGPRHEFIMHFCNGDPAVYGKRPPNLLQAAAVRGHREPQIHQTQKPREILETLIQKSTKPGDVVFDPFGGSYSTARTAMRLFRKSVSCELDPETHRTATSLVEKQLHNDPEYGIDWTELSNLRVVDTEIVEEMVAVADGGMISLVDDALEKRWDPEKAGVGIEEDSHFRELIEESRTAREEGVEAATLRDQQLEKMRSKYRSESLLERLLSWVTDRTTKNGGDTVE